MSSPSNPPERPGTRSILGPIDMGNAFIQTDFATGTLACAYGSNNAEGNILCAAFMVGSGPNDVTSVTDTLGNTWIKSLTINHAGEMLSTWFVVDCRPGVNTVTATLAVSGTSPQVQIGEWAGPSAFDTFSGSAGSGNASVGATASHSAELGVSFCWNSFGVFQGTGLAPGWNPRATFPDTQPALVQDNLNVSAGAIIASADVPTECCVPGDWLMSILLFRGTKPNALYFGSD
jgi:hypothetical protein